MKNDFHGYVINFKVNWLWCNSVLFSNEADAIAAKEWIESQIIINEIVGI